MTEAYKRPIAVLLAFLPVLAIGAGFGGDNNHSTYLNPGLKLAHPDMWAGDWWLGETTHYHVLFSYLVFALEKAGILKAAIALGNILAVFGSFYLIYLIIFETVKDKALQIFAAVVLLFVFLQGTTTVAQTFLFNNSFQPSTLGVVGYLLGIFFFIRGKYLYSGLSVGVLCLFHANYLILAFPLFGLAHILIREDDFMKRCVRQFTPHVICLLLLLPSILTTVDLATPNEVTAQALNILFTLRSPWHYDFSVFWVNFIPFFGWVFLGGSTLYLFKKKSSETGRLISLYKALALITGVAFIEALLIGSELMTRLFFWRLAPFALLISMIFIIHAAFSNSKQQPSGNKFFWVYYFLFIFGAAGVLITEGSLAIYSTTLRPMVFAYIAIILILLLAAKFVFSQKNRAMEKLQMPYIKSALIIGIPVLFILMQGPAPVDRCNFFYLNAGCDIEKEDLFSATRTMTDENALFIAPPALTGFRLATGRAMVASWKEAPFRPDEILEWHQRMADIIGLANINSTRELQPAYQSQDVGNLYHLRQKYKVDYAVFRKGASFNPAILEVFGPPFYENNDYYLFALNPGQGEEE